MSEGEEGQIVPIKTLALVSCRLCDARELPGVSAVRAGRDAYKPGCSAVCARSLKVFGQILVDPDDTGNARNDY